MRRLFGLYERYACLASQSNGTIKLSRETARELQPAQWLHFSMAVVLITTAQLSILVVLLSKICHVSFSREIVSKSIAATAGLMLVWPYGTSKH